MNVPDDTAQAERLARLATRRAATQPTPSKAPQGSPVRSPNVNASVFRRRPALAGCIVAGGLSTSALLSIVATLASHQPAWMTASATPVVATASTAPTLASGSLVVSVAGTTIAAGNGPPPSEGTVSSSGATIAGGGTRRPGWRTKEKVSQFDVETR